MSSTTNCPHCLCCLQTCTASTNHHNCVLFFMYPRTPVPTNNHNGVTCLQVSTVSNISVATVSPVYKHLQSQIYPWQLCHLSTSIYCLKHIRGNCVTCLQVSTVSNISVTPVSPVYKYLLSQLYPWLLCHLSTSIYCLKYIRGNCVTSLQVSTVSTISVATVTCLQVPNGITNDHNRGLSVANYVTVYKYLQSQLIATTGFLLCFQSHIVSTGSIVHRCPLVSITVTYISLIHCSSQTNTGLRLSAASYYWQPSQITHCLPYVSFFNFVNRLHLSTVLTLFCLVSDRHHASS